MKVARALFIYSFCFLVTIALGGCVTLMKAPSKPFGETSLTIPGDIESYHEKYKVSYIVWKALSEDMIEGLGGNRKGTLYTREYIILTLEKMESYLIDEGKELLTPHIEDFKAATEVLAKRRLNQGEMSRFKRALSRNMTEIQRQFSYRKAKQWIRPDVQYIDPEYMEAEE